MSDLRRQGDGLYSSLSQGIGRLWAEANSKLDLNFIKIHYLYFILTTLVSAGIFYASNTETHVDFTDCLFLCGESTAYLCMKQSINRVQ